MVTAAVIGALACGGGNRTLSTPSSPAPTPTPPPPSGTVLLADGFETGDLGQRWTSGTDCPPEANTIVVVAGRVRSLANCNYIQTRDSFSGNLRVEADVEKEGTHNHGCWDFYVGLSTPPAAGVIRFDTNGSDGVRVGLRSGMLCGDAVTGPPQGFNRGRAAFTYIDGQARFSFTGDDGRILEAGPLSVPRFDRTRVRIDLAAHNDAARYVDNVLVVVP